MNYKRMLCVLFLGVFHSQAFSTPTEPIADDVKARVSSIFGDESWYFEELRMLPKNVTGLGYKWLPIVITSKIEDAKFTAKIRPYNNVAKSFDLSKKVVYTKEKVVASVVESTMSGSHPGVSFLQCVLDPKEVNSAISELEKKEDGSYLIGIMSGFDGLEIEFNKEHFFLSAENLQVGGAVEKKVGDALLTIQLKVRPECDRRIFNQVLTIEIAPLD